MKAGQIPEDIAIPQGWSRVTFGPPPGMTEAQVYTHDALVGQIQEGPLDGSPCIAVLVELEDGDLDRIRASGHLWLRLMTTALPPWMLEPVDVPGRCRVCGCTDDDACDPPCSWDDLDHTICSACVEAVAP